MSNLQNVKRDISNVYFSTKNTAERYNILKEILEHIDDLRQKTVENIDNGYFDMEQSDNVLSKIQLILAESASCHIDTVKAVVHEDSKISHVCAELSLDSLDYIEFIMSVEQCFNVEISDYEAEEFRTISDIINHIIKK